MDGWKTDHSDDTAVLYGIVEMLGMLAIIFIAVFLAHNIGIAPLTWLVSGCASILIVGHIDPNKKGLGIILSFLCGLLAPVTVILWISYKLLSRFLRAVDKDFEKFRFRWDRQRSP